MIWLTWRQFRAQAATAVAALAAVAILLAITGPRLASLYAASGIAGCHGGSCRQLAVNFTVAASGYMLLYLLATAAVVLAPAVIGIFWGAPLIAREIETRTFGLATTQSITRARWLAVKLALTCLAAMAVTEGLSLMFGWWAAPIDQAARLANLSTPGGMIPLGLVAFDARGITPLGYAAFGFVLGVTTGLLIRRTVPAMAVTLAIFTALQVAFPQTIRPHLLPPDHASIAIGPGVDMKLSRPVTNRGHLTVAFTVQRLPSQPGAWILSTRLVNASGHPSAIPAACRQAMSFPPAGPQHFPACLAEHGMRVGVTYQPASRYWPFQWAETAIYLVLALALAGCCFWRISRRRLP